MSKTVSLRLLFAGVLLAALIAQAGGPKKTVIVTSDSGVTSGSVDVTLCGTTDCSSEFDDCPNTPVTGPNESLKTSCPLNNSGVKPVEAYRFAISINQGTAGATNCGGVALEDTPTSCTANGGGTITVSIK